MNTLDTNSKAIQSQRGYSLIELSLVLAVVAILLVGSLTGVQRILRSNTANNTLKETTTAVANVTTQTVRQANFAAVTLQNMSGLGVWDPARVASAGAASAVVTHPFGGPVYVNSSSVAVGSYGVAQTFKYTLANIPREVCADLVQGLDSMSYAIGVRNTASTPKDPAGGTLDTNYVVKAADSASVTLATLSTACTAAGNKDIDLIIARN